MSKVDDYYQQKFIGRYGSRRGFVRACRHKLLYMLGVYNNYRRIDWDKIERLVFVCKGNICRSAYAEAVAKSLGVSAISCGLSTKLDAPANADAIEIANDTLYGLGAGVWTRDAHQLYQIPRAIKAGRVWVNCYHVYPAHAPYGGYKKSGFWRENHLMMMNHYRQTKNMLISYDKNKLGFF